MNTTTHYDIAVCGGGFAGISAALAAAREGRKVILFEKEYLLGGLGTAGLVTVYLPLCDGCGHQVSFGIAEELLRLSITYGADAMYPDNWLDRDGPRGAEHHRFMVQYNPHMFAILAEQLLTREGVDILYGSYVVGARVEDGRITDLQVENKSGRREYTVRAVVDATGDADIAHLAGAPTATFSRGNLLAGWYYYADESGYKLRMLGVADDFRCEPTGERYTGLDGVEISDMVRKSHDMTLRHFLQRRETDPKASLATIATIPLLRMTRRMVGEYEMAHTDDHIYMRDSIGMVGNWKQRGPIYEIPFRALYNRKVRNLMAAGRCISTNEILWDAMRVIPCCAVTGQAAGTAAAMIADVTAADVSAADLTALDVAALQERLRARGVKLHTEDVL